MEVDYVISYRYANAGTSRCYDQSQPMHTDQTVVTEKPEAVAQFEKLIKALASVGLDTEVRAGEDYSLLVFVKEASLDHLYGEVYRSRYHARSSQACCPTNVV